jgi:phosphate/sulfate permease
MKINNYIKYLLTLILLSGINIYAQSSENLSQTISQSQQGISNLTSSLNLTLLNNITSQSWNFLFNYGLPFLFVFVVFLYLGWELLKKEGEINRPLLAVFGIIAIFVTYYFNAALIVIATFTGVILLFIWLYKLSHSITGSIIGSIIIIILAYIVLTNGTSIMGFLPPLAFYVLLFILFILISIYAYKLSQSSDIEKLKKIMYHIHKPEDVRAFENQVNTYITDFRNKALSLEQSLTNIQTKLNEFNNLLNQRQSIQQLRKQIQQILNKLQQILPPQLQSKIQILIQTPLQNIPQRQIRQIISQLKQIKSQSSGQHRQYIGRLINLLKQLNQQKQLLKQLKGLKREIKRLLNNYNKQYKDFNDNYNNIVNFITNALTHSHQNYNDPKNPGIIRFLTNKGNEVKSIKGNIDNKQMMILHNPVAQKLINDYILK